VGQFEILELWAKDHVQQKRPKTVVGDQYTLPRTVRARQINFAHAGSLSMALEIHFIKAIFPENKPPCYFFL
jgi:hypothetical protein